MDLGFPLPSADDATPVAFDAARMLASLADRRGADAAGSPADDPLAPADGAFSAVMAARLAAWRQE